MHTQTFVSVSCLFPVLPAALLNLPSCCRCSVNELWLDSHIEACMTQLGGKPLVLQEFNMPEAAASKRTEYYNYVSSKEGSERVTW